MLRLRVLVSEGAWLHDPIINFVGELINSRFKRRRQRNGSSAAAAPQHCVESDRACTAAEPQHYDESDHASTAAEPQHCVDSDQASTAAEAQHCVMSDHASAAAEPRHCVDSDQASTAAEPQTPEVHVFESHFFYELTKDTLSPHTSNGPPIAVADSDVSDEEPADTTPNCTPLPPRDVLERDYNYNNVRRWTTRLGYDVSLMQCVLFPLHLHANHWACAVLWPQRCKYAYIESWPGCATSEASDGYMAILKRWYLDEYNDKHKHAGAVMLTDADMAAWVRVTPSIMPLQKNWVDCGVFTLMALEWVAAGLEHHLTYTQADMPKLRRYIAACILQDEII